jgi:hypothetical protein
MGRLLILIAFVLALAAPVYFVGYAARQPRPPRWWLYPWLAIPSTITGLTLWRVLGRTRRAKGIIAAALVAYVFCPLSLSIRLLYVPTTLVMTIAAILKTD